MKSSLAFLICVGLLTARALAVAGEPAWLDPGPPASRDLFPLNLVALTYSPVGAVPLGTGEWRVAMQATRCNTFEFSDFIKNLLARDTSGRITVSQASMAQLAQTYPNQPLLFFFDGEVQRTELGFRRGLTPDTDVALTLGWQTVDGGFLDGLIENVHKLGFEQAGRDAIARNQLTLAVIQNGRLVYFTQTAVRARPVDPVAAVIHRVYESPWMTFSLLGRLQIPATEVMGDFHSRWDSSAGVLFQWRPSGRQVLDGGVAYLRRSVSGDSTANPFLIKDQLDGHLGYEWRGWSRVRPFFLLVYTSGLTLPQPGTYFSNSSLIHDLGMHLRLGPRSTLTFSYINNITHNENTSDMGFAVRLVVRP